MIVDHKLFFRLAHNSVEYTEDVFPHLPLIRQLKREHVDVFSFLERSWCFDFYYELVGFTKVRDNIALLAFDSYEDWLRNVKRITHRDPVKRAANKGVSVRVSANDAVLASGIWRIYNETPIRQNRRFTHFGVGLDTVIRNVTGSTDTFIGAYLGGELVGFLEMVMGSDTALINQILSLTAHSDKSINKALIAKAVEVCAGAGVSWIVYARMGNHPSLDRFKIENGFKQCKVLRYYLPLTWRGRVAVALGLHRGFKDRLPQWAVLGLLPVFNWVSRVRARWS